MNITQQIWIIFMFHLFFGNASPLRVDENGSERADKISMYDHQKNTDACTRSTLCSTDSHWFSKPSEHKHFEIVGDIMNAHNKRRGQLKRKHQTSGKIEVVNYEIGFPCKNTLLIHVYLDDTPKLVHNIQKKYIVDGNLFTMALKPDTGLQLVLNTTNNNTFRFHVELPQRQSVFQVIQLDNNTNFSSKSLDILRNKEMSNGKSSVEQEINRKIYDYTDGMVIPESGFKGGYIYGGYIFPFDTLCDEAETEDRNFSVTIALDKYNNAEGDIILSGYRESSAYIHLKIRLTGGHYLTINVIHSEESSEPMFIDIITVYGLFGYPDSFVIDKGKRYRLEDNLPENRRIDNRHRIYTFRNLQMDIRKNHIFEWTYF